MTVVGVVTVGEVVVVVRVSLSLGVGFGRCLSFSLSLSGPLADVMVVAVVAGKGIRVAVVGMSIGDMAVGVVAMGQVVEVVGISLRVSISNCSSLSLSFGSSLSISRSLSMVVEAVVATEGIRVGVVGVAISKMMGVALVGVVSMV